MDIKEFYDNISKQYCPILLEGTSETIQDFFLRCIKPNLPKKETIMGWDALLEKYINDNESIFFVRKYGSASNKNWNNIRRGFLTKFPDGFQYVYVDNFFAHYIYLMAINNFVPAYNDFKSFIVSRNIPYGFMQTSEEIGHQAFPLGKVVPLNRKGWKLAHLYPVNGDYSFDYKYEQENLFPLGSISDWHLQGKYEYPIKLSDKSLTDIQKLWIKAHFLRFIHPINYFPVPKRKCEQDSVNNDIGEYAPLIDYVYLYTSQIYANELEKYEKNIFAEKKKIIKTKDEIGAIKINIRYGGMIPQTEIKPQTVVSTVRNVESKQKNVKYTNTDILVGFSEYCRSPAVGDSGKGSSYEKAIQYLCEFLRIDLHSFTKDDLVKIKSIERNLTIKYSSFYAELLAYLKPQKRGSYLTGGFIRAALPYFYSFCNDIL